MGFQDSWEEGKSRSRREKDANTSTSTSFLRNSLIDPLVILPVAIYFLSANATVY